MMEKYLTVDIITPERVAYTDSTVSYISVPGESGTLGILPGHVSLYAKLTEGELKITRGKEELFLAIGGGFVQVQHNKVMVLVTRAVHAHEINEKEVLEAQKRAFELIKQKPDGEGFIEAQNLYRRSLVDLKVIKRRKRQIFH